MDLRRSHRSILGVVLFAAVPLVTGASGDGCGGDVVVGSDGPCKVGGCSGQLCVEPDDDGVSTCEWSDTYACYDLFGTCERADDGTCGWRPTAELQGCIDNGGPDPEPTPCVVTGCSGQLCADEELASTCEWTPAYACYDDFGICERDANGVCGWRQTNELTACLADPREPVSGECIRSNGDACESDADCITGGCGGEVCFNPDVSGGGSTCDCIAPALGCGCVQGQCTWFE